MRTSPAIVQQAALELEARLKGSKLQDAGRLSDGRIALLLWSRGAAQLVCLDVFGSPPLVTLETSELPIATEPGFVRSVATALRGTTLIAVHAKENDRVLRFDFGTRSRFGVESLLSLIVELVPRFGNIVLVKGLDEFEGGTIVSALREFSLAENQTRAIEAGRPYEPPPLRRNTPAIEQKLAGSILEKFSQARTAVQEEQASTAGNHHRDAFAKTLRNAERRTSDELASIAEKRAKAAAREDLRAEGDGIFATLHQLEESARDEAKERAAKLFAQYRKLGASLPHLDERETKLRALRESITHLQWELDRAQDNDLNDLEEAIEQTLGRKNLAQRNLVILRSGASRRTEGRRKRKPLELRTASGSRILIGRTPIENAELTFRIARPDDLWFHVQGQPGAHVILHRDDRSEPPDEDIVTAARLAAYHSKARNSTKVVVDYTYRKHVRKQPNAAPGLVFYTHASTKIVEPSAPGSRVP